MSKSRICRVVLPGFILLLALASGVFAQSQATTGVIAGTVVDENGGALPGATVTLRNTATNYEQVVTTGTIPRWETHFQSTADAFSTVEDRTLASVPAARAETSAAKCRASPSS